MCYLTIVGLPTLGSLFLMFSILLFGRRAAERRCTIGTQRQRHWQRWASEHEMLCSAERRPQDNIENINK